MSYDEWERSVPEEVRGDAIWSLRVYRTALYAGELGRRDSAWLAGQPGCAGVASQLGRATASISVNIAEGYSRRGRKDRAKFFEYALGSAREARDWYFKTKEALGEPAMLARLSLMTTIIKILIVLVARSRELAHAEAGA